MKTIKQFKIGSTYFFSDYPDFHSKDYDEICIMDTFPFKSDIMNAKIKKSDVFLCRNMPKSGFINDLINSETPMKAGKFLIPEFNEYIDFTIDDLKSIFYIFDNMDAKHTYEKIIAQAYIDNDSFTLTESQRLSAYEEYKKTRV